MKKIELTDEELRTLIWAVDKQFNQCLRLRSKNGQKGFSTVQKRLLSISKKQIENLSINSIIRGYYYDRKAI